MTVGIVISAAVEGILDEAVIRKLITHVGATPGDVYGKQGKAFLRQKIGAYNEAARRVPWIVLVDLDYDANCAPALRKTWLPNPAPGLCFRIAVREVEAWLLANEENLASFLGVSRKKILCDPEHLEDPKGTMVNLARASRCREIREDMVPRPESGRQAGPAYTSRLIEFVSHYWRPGVAAQHSESLERALSCISRLARICA